MLAGKPIATAAGRVLGSKGTPPPSRASSSPAPPSSAEPRRARTCLPWAELLQKVFAVDVLGCPRCDGRLQAIAFIHEPAVAKQILDHLGLESQAPPRKRSAPDGADQLEPGPEYDLVDASYSE